INDVFNRRSAHRPIERLCELLQRFPLFKQILGRFAAKRDQLRDWRAPVTYHDRPILTDASNKPILMHMRTTLNIDDKLIADASPDFSGQRQGDHGMDRKAPNLWQRDRLDRRPSLAVLHPEQYGTLDGG